MDPTAQLKGMLGIAVSSAAAVATDGAATVKTMQQPQSNSNNNTNGKPPSGTAKNKKNKNAKNKKQPNPTAAEKTNSTQAANNNNKQDKNNKQNKNNKKGNKQNNNTTSNNNKSNNKKPDSNFAWSAFQSSPDASNLPIPAFSPSVGKPIKQVPSSYAQAVSGAKLNVAPPADPAPPKEPSMPPPPPPPPAPTSPPPKPESNTGINLAAVIRSPAHTPTASSQPNLQPQPNNFVLNQNQYHGAHLHQPPPPHLMQPMQPMIPPHAPPGYMTIQVQVPPYLPPDRQMLVQTPITGYPVQVTVPQGIMPGAVIPVHVPAVPLHMMPPPNSHHPHHHGQMPPR